MNCRTAWLLGVLVVFVPGCNAKLTVVPKNVAVVEGDVAIMNCTTNSDYRLLWRIINNETHANATLSTIYTGNKFAKNYSEFCEISTSTKGQFTLKVRTRKEIPLHYVCEEPSVENSGADLVVLEANPVCAVVDDGRDLYSNVQMWCRVHFVGNWTPVMEWKLISAAGKESTDDIGSINTTSTSNVVISIINITADSSLNGSKYTCTTRFTEFSRCHKYAKQFVGRIKWPVVNNTPEYSSTWISQTLHIVTESNVSLFRLDKDSSLLRSVPAIIMPTVVAMCIVGCVILLIRFTTRRQKMSNLYAQNLASNTGDTLTAEYVELDGTPRAAAEDIHVLPVYKEIIDGSEGSFSRVPCLNEGPAFTQGEYAVADDHSCPTPFYTSLFTISE